jgi:hypothetical protein
VSVKVLASGAELDGSAAVAIFKRVNALVAVGTEVADALLGAGAVAVPAGAGVV